MKNSATAVAKCDNGNSALSNTFFSVLKPKRVVMKLYYTANGDVYTSENVMKHHITSLLMVLKQCIDGGICPTIINTLYV